MDSFSWKQPANIWCKNENVQNQINIWQRPNKMCQTQIHTFCISRQCRLIDQVFLLRKKVSTFEKMTNWKNRENKNNLPVIVLADLRYYYEQIELFCLQNCLSGTNTILLVMHFLSNDCNMLNFLLRVFNRYFWREINLLFLFCF